MSYGISRITLPVYAAGLFVDNYSVPFRPASKKDSLRIESETPRRNYAFGWFVDIFLENLASRVEEYSWVWYDLCVVASEHTQFRVLCVRLRNV